MSVDMLKKRYLAKLSANLIGVLIGLVSQAIIMRGLGPGVYGDFGFLSNFFTRVVGFFDMGTSVGFYTKLSQRQNDFGLISFYLGFYTGLVSIFMLIFLVGIHVTKLHQIVLPQQKLFFIYLAMIWAILSFIVQNLNRIADAYGVTVSTEIARIFQRMLGLLIIVILFFMNQLTLTHFFFYHYFLFAFLGLAVIWIAEHSGHSFIRSWKLTFAQIKAYVSEFYHYCHPLIISSFVVLIVGILDRWMLQEFGGSEQQGYFTFAYQIGAVYFLVSSAIIPLLLREFAISFEGQNLHKMAASFHRYILMFYFVTAYFACFGAVEADKVTLIMGGEKYSKAVLAVIIMSLFTMFQFLGQFNASVFYATGRTKLYRNIGIANNILGLPISYLLIAPDTKLGLGMGATGLAIKMAILTIITVNIRLFFNTRFLDLKFRRYVAHQVLVSVCLLGIAVFARLLVDRGFGLAGMNTTSFLLNGIFYTLIVMLLIYFRPTMFGFNKKDAHFILNYFKILKQQLVR
jgi:O-antigen/teichoic acid export membrane protein